MIINHTDRTVVRVNPDDDRKGPTHVLQFVVGGFYVPINTNRFEEGTKYNGRGIILDSPTTLEVTQDDQLKIVDVSHTRGLLTNVVDIHIVEPEAPFVLILEPSMDGIPVVFLTTDLKKREVTHARRVLGGFYRDNGLITVWTSPQGKVLYKYDELESFLNSGKEILLGMRYVRLTFCEEVYKELEDYAYPDVDDKGRFPYVKLPMEVFLKWVKTHLGVDLLEILAEAGKRILPKRIIQKLSEGEALSPKELAFVKDALLRS